MNLTHNHDYVGHFRVVVGYDDIQQTVWMNDPWGRYNYTDDQIYSLSYENFQKSWNYTEYGASGAYFAALILPWMIDATWKKGNEIGKYQVTVTVEYYCDFPFPCEEFIAKGSTIRISVLPNILVSPSPVFYIGDFKGGRQIESNFEIAVLSTYSLDMLNFTVSATGFVSGSIPEHQNPPLISYSYQDEIGSEKSFSILLE